MLCTAELQSNSMFLSLFHLVLPIKLNHSSACGCNSQNSHKLYVMFNIQLQNYAVKELSAVLHEKLHHLRFLNDASLNAIKPKESKHFCSHLSLC